MQLQRMPPTFPFTLYIILKMATYVSVFMFCVMCMHRHTIICIITTFRGMNKDGKREDYLPWEDYFMAVAALSSLRSKDPVTQVGVV